MTVPNLEPAQRRSAPLHLRLLSDERLTRRAERGDRRASEAISQRYHQDLYRFCLAMTGNPVDAETALRRTMTRAQQGLEAGERQIRLKPWLYRIARNETVDAVRGPHETGAPEPKQRRLIADLEQLPQRQRAVLVMRELSELDFAQIGAAFGISATVAMEDVYEARLKLRQLQEGREQLCAKVMWELSEVDGRACRRRKIRAHLRHCPDCRAFQDEIAVRRGDLAALSPLPLAGGGSGIAGTVAAMVGEGAGTSAAVKAAATVAVVAATGLSVAEQDRLTDPVRPTWDGGESSWIKPPSHRSPLSSGREESAVAIRRSATPPAPSPHLGPAVEEGQSRAAIDTPDPDLSEIADPGGGSARSTPDPSLPEVHHGQLTSQPHEGLDTPPEETHETYEAAVSDTTHPAPPASSETPVEGTEEPPNAGPEPAAPPPGQPSEAETPAAPPSPPAYEGGPSRRSGGEWSRGHRPRHRR